MSPLGNVVTRRSDYRAPGALVPRVELCFELDPQFTRITAILHLRRNTAADATADFTLYGEQLTLESIVLDNQPLAPDAYTQSEDRLVLPPATIAALHDTSTLTFVTNFNPSANLALEGLYVTSGTFCTQCEAEGFRRITYFPDRPDILSEYTVTIQADKQRFPVLLANGNLVNQRDLPDGQHETIWHDPFHKPSYLFALVAGQIDRIQDHFITVSGRNVLLEIYSSTANLPRCAWAMECLKAAMRWDEMAYGREYDLDRFMIYAADDFNMGAMENKGLNVFNSRFLLADSQTATDSDFQLIDAIVAHEYFHNWSGNRVTCRDWFQLSLKEGFTVFREQQYSAYRGSPAVVRIEEVAFMQAQQFAQDAGPMAHPIRPDEYEAIDNFYTVTVYEKGAEVIRMLYTLLGAETYRKGTDLYFSRHDGTAATCDDFVRAMEDASGRDLSQFKYWYSQAGTPVLNISEHFDAAQQRYTLTVAQSTPLTPKQSQKAPMIIPVALALLDPLQRKLSSEQVLTVTEARQSFHFNDIPRKPIPSILRGFSAPVKIEFDYADEDLALLVYADNDAVVRWQALRTLFLRAFDALASGHNVSPMFDRAIADLLDDRHSDPALLAHLLNPPSHNELADSLTVIDAQLLANTRDALWRYISERHGAALLLRYRSERDALSAKSRTYCLDAASAAHRALANTALMLANADIHSATGLAAQKLAWTQWEQADNLTDVIGAMRALRDVPNTAGGIRDDMYRAFHDRWQNESLMLNRWFQLEASTQRIDAIIRIHELLAHPRFDTKNPNRVRAIVHIFGNTNWRGFHAEDASGYDFMAEQILRFDAQNPSLSARFCEVFSRWYRFTADTRKLQEAALRHVAAHSNLSTNVREVIEKTLQAESIA